MLELPQLLLKTKRFLQHRCIIHDFHFSNTASGALLQLIIAITITLLIVLLVLMAYIFYRRRLTQRLLERAGLPTVYWTPRFVQYNDYQQDDPKKDEKLKSTSITRMLPRMERLQGPMGMYGTVYGFNTAVVHIAHPVAAKAVLTQCDSGAAKAPAYNHFFNFCGRGVFTAEGPDWKAKRISVLHALLRGKGSFEDRVLQQAHLAGEELVELIKQHSQSEPLTGFNVVPLIQQCTVGLIYRYITHTEIPNDAKKPAKSNAIAASPSLLQQYLQSVTNIRMIILAQSRSIWYLLPRWFYAAFANLYQQEEETMVPIRHFAHLACQNALPGSPLRQLEQDESHQNGNRMFNPTTGTTVSQDLLEEAITLLFAGQDTSAATLSWTLHLLTLSPEIQNKLANEVHSVLGEYSNAATNVPAITKAMINQMPYLDAVIKESMRLYPVAPFVVRKLSNDVTVSKETTLPKGAMACLWIYGLHHHQDYWESPEDFIPERWLGTADTSSKDLGISNGAYMPFAIGPRNCLGQPLAQWILRSLLARIVFHCEVQDATHQNAQSIPSPSCRKDMQAGFTVLPRGGVNLIVRDRIISS